jgi:tetratricopeptide (TPR) repeat protein
LTLAKSLEPPQPAQVARAHIDLAGYLSNIRELADAEAHLHAALAFEATGALDVRDLADAHGSLAHVYDELGRYEAAVMSARKALALQIEAHGADAVPTGSAHVTLGQLLGQMGQFDEARWHFETGLETLERRLGSDHRETLKTLNNLAILHLNAGDLEQAAALQQKLLEKLLEHFPRVQGERSMLVGDAYQNLGTTLSRMGRLSEAGEMHEQAAAIYRSVFAPDNYRRALPLLSLSNIRLAEGQYLAAEAAVREALPILTATLPAGHYVPALAECRLGRALIGQERNAEAKPFMDRSASTFRESGILPGFSQEYRRECLEAAASFYTARGRRDDAAAARAALPVAPEPD